MVEHGEITPWLAEERGDEDAGGGALPGSGAGDLRRACAGALERAPRQVEHPLARPLPARGLVRAPGSQRTLGPLDRIGGRGALHPGDRRGPPPPRRRDAGPHDLDGGRPPQRSLSLGSLCAALLAGCGGPWEATLSLENTSSPGDLVASDGSTHDIKLAPGLIILHDDTFSLFSEGEAASSGLEALAEDGDPAILLDTLAQDPGVVWFEVLSTLTGDTYEEAPLSPGDQIEVSFTAARGELLTFAQMYGESNDIFLATVAPIAVTGDLDGALTGQLALFDAGTELNQEPGLGADQAPRQSAPGAGTAENATITRLSGGADAEGWSYPDLGSFVALTVTLEEVSDDGM